MRNSVSNIVVNSLDSSGFLNFDILVEDIRRQVLAPHLTIRSDHNLVDLEGFGEGPRKTEKNRSILVAFCSSSDLKVSAKECVINSVQLESKV